MSHENHVGAFFVELVSLFSFKHYGMLAEAAHYATKIKYTKFARAAMQQTWHNGTHTTD